MEEGREKVIPGQAGPESVGRKGVWVSFLRDSRGTLQNAKVTDSSVEPGKFHGACKPTLQARPMETPEVTLTRIRNAVTLLRRNREKRNWGRGAENGSP